MTNGLDPSSCGLMDKSHGAFDIAHQASHSWFSVGLLPPNFAWSGRKGVHSDPEERWESGSKEWGSLLNQVAIWAGDVVRWEDVPDLWQLRAGPEFMARLEQAAGNARFTVEELAAVDARIEEVRLQVRATFELTAAQLEVIDAKLDEIKEASRRVGRKDWVLIAMGTVVTTIVTDSVTPGVIHSVVGMVLQGLAHLFGMPAPLAVPPA